MSPHSPMISAWTVLLLGLLGLQVRAELPRLPAEGAAAAADGRRPHYDANGAFVVPVSDVHTEQLVARWSEQSVSSVIAALADQRLRTHRATVRRAFGDCTRKAADVQQQALCFQRLERGDFTPAQRTGQRRPGSRLERLRAAPKPEDNAWVGRFRTARRRKRSLEVRRQDEYRLKEARSVAGPFGRVAQQLLRSVLEAKNKTRRFKWQDVVEKARLLSQDKQRVRQKLDDSDEELHSDPLRMRALYKSRLGGAEGGQDPEQQELSAKLEKLERLSERPAEAARLVQEFVRQKDRPNRRRGPNSAAERLGDLLREGVKLGYSLAGQNTSDFDERPLRIVSPRFFSLMPEQQQGDQVELASPSLLSLHDQGRGVENLTSLPRLLQAMSEEDRQAWLDLVVEASGVSDQLQDLTEDLDEMQNELEQDVDRYRREIRAPDGRPLFFSKENATRMFGTPAEQRVQHWEHFHGMLSKAQLSELNRTGLALLDARQQQHVYGPGSPYADPRALRDFQHLDRAQVLGRLHEDVRRLAQPGSRFSTRLRDTVLAPVAFSASVNVFSVLNPSILSPVIFSPLILSPTVLGPMILSPWIFTPLILAPKLLSPLILAPYIFSPLILSPLVLHPQILSPGVFNPHVLVPFLISPLILTPQVFSPLILCPQVLSPVILNPTVGSPKVLSPFVLSPSVFSPQALSALVLSPYALSPLFYSKVYFFRLILSPSWLS